MRKHTWSWGARSKIPGGDSSESRGRREGRENTLRWFSWAGCGGRRRGASVIPGRALHGDRWHFRESTGWHVRTGQPAREPVTWGSVVRTGTVRVAVEDTLHVMPWRLTLSSILSSLGVRDIRQGRSKLWFLGRFCCKATTSRVGLNSGGGGVIAEEKDKFKMEPQQGRDSSTHPLLLYQHVLLYFLEQFQGYIKIEGKAQRLHTWCLPPTHPRCPHPHPVVPLTQQ